MTGIGPIVRARRVALGRTLAQVAAAVQCSKAYLSAIENDRLTNPPSAALLERLEAALQIADGQLRQAADWQRTPANVRAKVAAIERRSRQLTALLKHSAADRDAGGRDLDALYRSGKLAALLETHEGNIDPLGAVRYQVPLINRVAAGYPSEFTDLDYPARVADEYVAVPEVSDPQAFAARVVGESMQPAYGQGDVIVFSPARAAADGDDCFIRLEPDHQTTFKRVYFEGEAYVRLQPLNPAFAARTVPLEQVTGLWPAVYRLQRLGGG